MTEPILPLHNAPGPGTNFLTSMGEKKNDEIEEIEGNLLSNANSGH